jgi:hypothetical protein
MVSCEDYGGDFQRHACNDGVYCDQERSQAASPEERGFVAGHFSVSLVESFMLFFALFRVFRGLGFCILARVFWQDL